MKYGDILESKWRYVCWAWRNNKPLIYRYRIDPVPFIHKRHACFSDWYKLPKVMNEKRQWDKKYGRTKRNPMNLPDARDDYPRADIYDRSWKKSSKKRKQWM